MPERKPSLCFAKDQHLRKKAEFDQVFQAGDRVGSRHLLARVVPNSLDHPRVGFAVPKGVGCIAKRNRVRRVMREAFRLHQHEIPDGVDLVLLPKRAWTDYRLRVVEPSMQSLLRKIHAQVTREVDRYQPR